jgi:hypothetical protein
MKQICTVLLCAMMVLLTCGCATPPEQLSGSGFDPLDLGLGTVARAAVDGEPLTNIVSPVVQHGFAAVDFRARRDEYDRVYVVGEIRNVGEEMKGVELQATLRDAAGRVVAVGYFYPAADYSIAPNQNWPFAHSFGKQTDGVEAELRIVGAFRTIDNLSTVSLLAR